MGEKKAEVPVGKELVRMTGIMKEFPGVKALDNVKLDLYAGEVLALLGENGAVPPQSPHGGPRPVEAGRDVGTLQHGSL